MKQMYIDALSNTGASMVIIGICVCCMAGNVITALLGLGIVFIGVLLVFGADYIMDKIEQKEKQKNKGHRTAKHQDLYN